MTDEELDEARAREALRRVGAPEFRRSFKVDQAAVLAARLAREGWVPVDPDLIEAREIAAQECEAKNNSIGAQCCRDGAWDEMNGLVPACLAAIKRGRELERNK